MAMVKRLKMTTGMMMAGLASLMLLGACASVLKPDVETAPEAVRAGAYALDPAHAAVVWRIDHLGYSTYVGRFERVDASLDFDAQTPASARLEAIVDISSLDVANPEFEQTLLGPDWFDAAAHPQAIFRSDTITVTGPQTGRVDGQLTLKGVTRPVSMDVTFNGGGNDLLRGAYVTGFSGVMVIDRTAFDIDRFSGLLADEIEIELQAEFIRKAD